VIQEPIQPTSSPDPAARSGAGSRRDTLLLVGVIIAILVATSVAIAVGARSQDPDRTLAAGASAAPATSAVPAGKDDGQHADKKPKAAKGFSFQGGGPGRGQITITAIDGNRLSLATPDGWTRTITTSATTVITKGGQTIPVTALKVGDEVRLRQVRNADGSYTVTAITVPTAQVGGEVTAVNGTTITVQGKRDAARVITVNGATVYKLGSAAASKADVTVGSEVTAAGTLEGDIFTAITVWIARPSVAGEVTGKTADTITVKRKDGSTATIHVSSTTTYATRGDKTASLADIAVGSRVTAVGTLRADGSLDAASVLGKPAKPAKPTKPSTKAPNASSAPTTSAAPG
jgi:hypothetical protein